MDSKSDIVKNLIANIYREITTAKRNHLHVTDLMLPEESLFIQISFNKHTNILSLDQVNMGYYKGKRLSVLVVVYILINAYNIINVDTGTIIYGTIKMASEDYIVAEQCYNKVFTLLGFKLSKRDVKDVAKQYIYFEYIKTYDGPLRNTYRHNEYLINYTSMQIDTSESYRIYTQEKKQAKLAAQQKAADERKIKKEKEEQEKKEQIKIYNDLNKFTPRDIYGRKPCPDNGKKVHEIGWGGCGQYSWSTEKDAWIPFNY